jgi:hypothetical protein
LLIGDFGARDFSSITDEEVPEKSACKGHETFQVGDADMDNEADMNNEADVDNEADLDNEDDPVPSEFDWWKVRYFSSVEPKQRVWCSFVRKLVKKPRISFTVAMPFDASYTVMGDIASRRISQRPTGGKYAS